MNGWRYDAGKYRAPFASRFSGFRDAVVVDVETTGFNPQGDRIVSVAMVRADFGRLQAFGSRQAFVREACAGGLNVLVNPQRVIPASASAVHGIHDRDVRGRPSFRELASVLQAYLGDALVIAHNVSFDKRFLEAEFRRCGLGQALRDNQVLCTMRRFQEDNYGQRKGSSLAAVAAALGVGGRAGTLHEAFEDARLALEIAVVYYMRDNGVRLAPGASVAGLVG